jgi:Ca2+/H+ antiporter, TMEM165/GDT1 family
LFLDVSKVMEQILVSTAVAAFAEIGDKTQLLVLVLASRFKQPAVIIAAALLATLVNHGLAATLGVWVPTVLSQGVLRWVLGLSFLGLASWTVMTGTREIREAEVAAVPSVFGASAIALFLAEMGDKTQVVTVALAARYGNAASIVMATTLGVLLADVPAVLVGCKVARMVPVRFAQNAGAAVLALVGIATLISGAAGRPS